MPEIDLRETIKVLQTNFIFTDRPILLPADLKPSWRIGLIVLLLKNCCRGGKSSLTRVHVLSWGIRTKETRLALQAAIRGDSQPGSLIVRFEPSLNRAIDYAWGEDLIRRPSGNRIELTGAGRELATQLESQKDSFVTEKLFMDSIRYSLNEKLITEIFAHGA